MKTTTTFVYNLLAAVALLLCSMQGYTQNCVSCNNNVIDTLNFSSAIGTENISTGINSFASGYQNQALGDYSFVSGRESKSLRNYSAVIGSWSTADGLHSFVIGSQSKSLSNYGYIFGRSSKVQNSSAMLIGYYLSSGANSQIVIGNGLDTLQPLTCNQPYSLAVGFNSTVPTFFVGQSSGLGTTGRVGIGNVTDPQAKLHIRADENEHATLRLEATGSNKHSRLYFSDDIYLTATPQNNLSFSLPENNNLIFENGKVGIGTSQPQAKLHVHGDFQVGDTANPQNMRLYGSINATGEYATAFGNGNIASGNYSFVAGRNSEANQSNAIVIGSDSRASGGHSYVIGSTTFALGNFSYAFGGNSTSESDFSLVLGHNLISRNGAFVIGKGNVDAKLTNVHQESLMIGFNSAFPTLFVSRTQHGYQTGKVGIGNVTDPQAKLHIRADANEHATLRLEATGSDKHSRINFTNAHQILASANDDMHFHTAEGKGYIFHGGDIYLSDIQSGIIMKSPNGQCWRGVMSDNGQLVFSATDCPDGAVSVPKPTVEPALQMKIYPNPTDGTITIEVHDGVTNADWSLRSTDGALLMRNRITSGKTEISLAPFVAGVYVISIEQNGRLIASEKVVKQ
jgi:hypothetical protein